MDLRLADFYTCIINICEPLFKKNIGTCSTVMSQNVFILINVISHGMIMSVKNIKHSFIIRKDKCDVNRVNMVKARSLYKSILRKKKDIILIENRLKYYIMLGLKMQRNIGNYLKILVFRKIKLQNFRVMTLLDILNLLMIQIQYFFNQMKIFYFLMIGILNVNYRLCVMN